MCVEEERVLRICGYIGRRKEHNKKQLINSTPTSKFGRGDQKQILAILSSYHATVIVHCPQRACKLRRN